MASAKKPKSNSPKVQKEVYTVKREGHLEPFDDKKLYSSAYASCLNAHLSTEKSEEIAEKVLKEVKSRLAGHEGNVSSSHLSILVYEALKKYDKDAAFLYQTHLDLS